MSDFDATKRAGEVLRKLIQENYAAYAVAERQLDR